MPITEAGFLNRAVTVFLPPTIRPRLDDQHSPLGQWLASHPGKAGQGVNTKHRRTTTVQKWRRMIEQAGLKIIGRIGSGIDANI